MRFKDIPLYLCLEYILTPNIQMKIPRLRFQREKILQGGISDKMQLPRSVSFRETMT
jgi:hypothetical protein